jgi:putative membrane protein
VAIPAREATLREEQPVISISEKRALIVAYLVAATVLGVRPVDRADWALENLVPLLEGLAFVFYARWRPFEFTRLSWYLVFVHLIVQAIGGHYTYERVPAFDWLRDALGWSRNHYDRLAHFALGFCLYVPIREICLRRTPLGASRRWAAFFTLSLVMAIAGMWEVWEWIVATGVRPDLGSAYLGLQGDIWDAQKDMILAPIGATFALFLLTRSHDAQMARVAEEQAQIQESR